MLFDDETEAFESYASVMPNNCVFLVDTFDTLEGVRAAAHVGQTLKQRGHKMVGVRLDRSQWAMPPIFACTSCPEAPWCRDADTWSWTRGRCRSLS